MMPQHHPPPAHQRPDIVRLAVGPHLAEPDGRHVGGRFGIPAVGDDHEAVDPSEKQFSPLPVVKIGSVARPRQVRTKRRKPPNGSSPGRSARCRHWSRPRCCRANRPAGRGSPRSAAGRCCNRVPRRRPPDRNAPGRSRSRTTTSRPNGTRPPSRRSRPAPGGCRTRRSGPPGCACYSVRRRYRGCRTRGWNRTPRKRRKRSSGSAP